jgi:hypothetical protein
VLRKDPTVRIEDEFRRRMLDRVAGAMTKRCQGEELAKFAEKPGRAFARGRNPKNIFIPVNLFRIST